MWKYRNLQRFIKNLSKIMFWIKSFHSVTRSNRIKVSRQMVLPILIINNLLITRLVCTAIIHLCKAFLIWMSTIKLHVPLPIGWLFCNENSCCSVSIFPAFLQWCWCECCFDVGNSCLFVLCVLIRRCQDGLLMPNI